MSVKQKVLFALSDEDRAAVCSKLERLDRPDLELLFLDDAEQALTRAGQIDSGLDAADLIGQDGIQDQ